MPLTLTTREVGDDTEFIFCVTDLPPPTYTDKAIEERHVSLDNDYGAWSCILYYHHPFLTISLKLVQSRADCALPPIEYLHLVPHKSPGEGVVQKLFLHKLQTGFSKAIHFDFHERIGIFVRANKIQMGNVEGHVAFDIVLSNRKSLPPKCAVESTLNPNAYTKVRTPSTVSGGKSFKELFPERYQDMLALLSDAGSVNAAFMFTIHNCARDVTFWIHRVMLNKYPRLQQLFADPAKVIIPVEGISLATLCVLMKYIYTEDLDLTLDPSQFLICDMEHLPPSSSMSSSTASSAVLTKALKEYNAAQFYASWGVKDKVSWLDLFLAADRFQIEKLREQCLQNLLASVDKNSAIEILFGIGTCFKEEIREPIVEYISRHLDSVFSLHDKDPFKRFADHADCHSVMLELLRLENKKVIAVDQARWDGPWD
ncbi:hypothetical protein EDD21DRAFT_153607 [Dissophora ornata]|nr:hypothetical protein EDD21DRAFT_153607 [Dissophora ornata]